VEDFVGAKFYCLHALADSNQCIQITEKMLEFSSTVLSTPPPYLYIAQQAEHSYSYSMINKVIQQSYYRPMPFLSSNR